PPGELTGRLMYTRDRPGSHKCSDTNGWRAAAPWPLNSCATSAGPFCTSGARAGAGPEARSCRVRSVVLRLLNRRADAAELRAGVAAKEAHGADADDRNQGDEQGVLHERSTLLIRTKAGPQVRGAKLLPVGDEVHVLLLIRTCPTAGLAVLSCIGVLADAPN